jgi:hypothetical protein
MTRITAFYSVYEAKKPPPNRVYHNDNVCPSARDIPQPERRPGNGGYRLCRNCR